MGGQPFSPAEASVTTSPLRERAAAGEISWVCRPSHQLLGRKSRAVTADTFRRQHVIRTRFQIVAERDGARRPQEHAPGRTHSARERSRMTYRNPQVLGRPRVRKLDSLLGRRREEHGAVSAESGRK